MSTNLARIALIAAAIVLGSGAWTNAQEEARKLFESGKYQAAVEQTRNDAPPDGQYVKGLAPLKLNQTDQAKAALRRREGAGESWRSVGNSPSRLSTAIRRRARSREGGRGARWRSGVGPVSARGLCSKLAAKACGCRCFCESGGSQPQMAYAHYNAG